MTKEELHERFHDALYYSENNAINLSIVGCEKLLELFQDALEMLENEPENARNMWHRLDAVIGFLLDMKMIDWPQDVNLCDLANEVCNL